MMTPACPRLLNMITDFVLLRFWARASEDLSAIEVILYYYIIIIIYCKFDAYSWVMTLQSSDDDPLPTCRCQCHIFLHIRKQRRNPSGSISLEFFTCNRISCIAKDCGNAGIKNWPAVEQINYLLWIIKLSSSITWLRHHYYAQTDASVTLRHCLVSWVEPRRSAIDDVIYLYIILFFQLE